MELQYGGTKNSIDKSSVVANGDLISDQHVKMIVDEIVNKLSKIKGFTALTETCGLDPNGGFDKFREEVAFLRQDKMHIQRNVIAAHNSALR